VLILRSEELLLLPTPMVELLLVGFVDWSFLTAQALHTVTCATPHPAFTFCLQVQHHAAQQLVEMMVMTCCHVLTSVPPSQVCHGWLLHTLICCGIPLGTW
jgi:hypothetical protein